MKDRASHDSGISSRRNDNDDMHIRKKYGGRIKDVVYRDTDRNRAR